MATRSLIYAANWKMNLGPSAARDFLARFLQVTAPAPGRRLWFFPPAVTIAAVCEAVSGREDVTAGAQNVHWEPKGAFTGELSIPLVMEAGAKGALVGHSERRHLFGETDEQVARKLAALRDQVGGFGTLLVIGHEWEPREAWIASLPEPPATEGLSWGSFLVDNLVPVTIGNVLGGTVLVAALYWFVYLRPPRPA